MCPQGMESEGDFKMKKFIPFIIMVMVVLGVLVGVYFVQKSMDESGPPSIMFSATDRNGTHYSESVFSENKITMVNMWEPWCGPCVGEMPDLERIYEEHKDEGFVILGVFSETGMDEDAYQVLEEAGITYPILRMSSEFAALQTDYVPTTVFMTGDGRLLMDEPVIGSQSYASWNAAVMELLDGLN